MRTISHWTVGYIYNRIIEKWYRRQNPDLPWITPDSYKFLDQYLQPCDIGVEFGSGRSTLWFAKKVSKLYSVEHDAAWYEIISKQIAEAKLINVSYYLFDIVDIEEGILPAYVDVINEVKDTSLDFVMVDGKYRDLCALASINKLKSNGILILDNADVYLPAKYKTPNARSGLDGAASSKWEEFIKITDDWRKYWTCNGVSATTIFFKP